ncbi:hypothetical protein LIA77_10615 [Sarocladium implicatum]|nr:hypothetical protein LIA77_10615 [Sarocladium implicatum]
MIYTIIINHVLETRLHPQRKHLAASSGLCQLIFGSSRRTAPIISDPWHDRARQPHFRRSVEVCLQQVHFVFLTQPESLGRAPYCNLLFLSSSLHRRREDAVYAHALAVGTSRDRLKGPTGNTSFHKPCQEEYVRPPWRHRKR